MYEAGADTTYSALLNFILVMTVFPEYERKAQAEIDRVVGLGWRLPDFRDGELLLYVEAILLEIQRWAILHDEVYPDPYTFNPERWTKDGKDQYVSPLLSVLADGIPGNLVLITLFGVASVPDDQPRQCGSQLLVSSRSSISRGGE
ncbi:hypothetical protein E1B28_001614 [Marasmius oreades]|uniref:Cytochrome P450 n=1 Tax=Marasmius oreades TaxID=181124 RepID=A0A9P7V444_9AGAR|nr:uncharacterized protein E1B28_001614 [Marasmius oreades]KAG7099802.1 hypothetical protein E1B28_001614 [Marasmius oreades]